MFTLLSPKNDYVFKQLFTHHIDILIDLINSVLLLPDKKAITHLTVKNPQILPKDIDEKYIILDINASDQMNNHYDIEMHKEGNMQTMYKNPMIHRAIDMLNALSADDKIRMEAERREKALRNKFSELYAAKLEGKEEGMREGKEEGKEETAKKLLSMKVLTVEQIALATDLSVEAVQQLR